MSLSLIFSAYNGRIRVWIRKSDALNAKYMTKSVKHDRWCVMVWGYMSATGVENANFIEIKMYKTFVLKRNLKNVVLSLCDNFKYKIAET